jgi:porin
MRRNHALLFICLLATATTARAQTPATSGTEGWNLYTAMTNAGFSFPVSYIGEVLGNPSGGNRQGVIYDGLLEAGVTVDLGKLVNWQGAMLTVDGLYPHGSSLTRNDVGDYNVLSNIDALHNPRLYEAWIQQDLDAGRFSIRAGQIPINTEFGVSSGAAIFLNSAFGTAPTLGLNLDVAVYPVAAPGVRVSGTLNDSWTVLAGVFDGNDGDPGSDNRNGLRYNFNGRDGAMLMGETAYTLNPPPATPAQERPLSGTYKLGAFYNTGRLPEETPGPSHYGTYGAYLIADQELWHVPELPGEGLNAFAEISGAPEHRNQVSFYCQGGFDYTGLIPGRKQDVMGLGLSYTKLTGAEGYGGADPNPDHYETVLELTYQANVNAWLQVQPDAQYIFDPGGLGNEPDALVMGLRFTMTF